MDEIESLFIDFIPKCINCGKGGDLLHSTVDLSGNILSYHCDDCCEKTHVDFLKRGF